MKKILLIIFITANGNAIAQNVGIGVTIPLYKLDVKGNINTDSFYRIAGDIVLSVKGVNNIFAGVESGSYNSTGHDNSSYGFQALTFNSLGTDNIAIGSNALYANGTSSQNIAIGNYALYNQSFNPGTPWSSGNVAIGHSTLMVNNPTSTSNGISNTAIGNYAMNGNTIGYDNTALGAAALYTNDEGYENTAIGRQALFFNTTGDDNTSTGYKSLRSNSTGYSNTAHGEAALYANTTGTGNAALGDLALYTNITGDNNIGIGHYSDVDLTGTFGNVAIGAFSHISGYADIAIGEHAYTNVNNLALLGNTNTIQIGGYANWSNFSDGRFKTNVDEEVIGLDFILRLRPVTYHMDIKSIYKLWGINPYGKNDSSMSVAAKQQIDEAIANKESIRMSGFIAQEVEKAANESGYDFDGVIKPAHDKDHYRLAYGEFVVPLVKAMQEQQKLIEEMKKEIEALKKKIGGNESIIK